MADQRIAHWASLDALVDNATNPASTNEYDTHCVAVVRGPGPIAYKD